MRINPSAQNPTEEFKIKSDLEVLTGVVVRPRVANPCGIGEVESREIGQISAEFPTDDLSQPCELRDLAYFVRKKVIEGEDVCGHPMNLLVLILKLLPPFLKERTG
jgi:hypothetical protein